MHKNTWYAVYHQQELDFLARSYQPGYFFILMGRKPLTEYLPIDGSKSMAGHFIPKIHNTYDIGSTSNFFRWIYGVYFWALLRIQMGTGVPIRTGAGSTYAFYLQSYDTAYRSCIELINGMANIPRAGDIIGLAGKTLDFPLFKVGGVAGVDGTFTTIDGKTVTVTKGIITSIV